MAGGQCKTEKEEHMCKLINAGLDCALAGSAKQSVHVLHLKTRVKIIFLVFSSNVFSCVGHLCCWVTLQRQDQVEVPQQQLREPPDQITHPHHVAPLRPECAPTELRNTRTLKINRSPAGDASKHFSLNSRMIHRAAL